MDRRCALYRHYSSSGDLLYVGISNNVHVRTKQHMEGSHWADEIARIEVDFHPDRPTASTAEAKAVRELNPKYNRVRFASPGVPKPSVGEDIPQQIIVKVEHHNVEVKAAYKLKDAADAFGINIVILKREIEAGNVKCFKLPNTVGTGEIVYLSGWSLVDWIKSLEDKQ